MSEQPPSDNTASSSSAVPAAPKKKKKRWWLRILIAVPVLLILIVLLAPTIISTSPVRSIIVSQANGFLNGKLTMDDLSVGWTSGVSVKGVKLFDDQNAQILELKSLDAPISLIGAAKGNFDLKTITVDGLNGVLKIDKNGQMNFANLVKQAKEAAKEKASEPVAKTKAGKLPDVTGSIVVKNSKFTIEQEGKPPVFIDTLDANIKIPNINQPVQDDLVVILRVGDGKPGTIKVSGNVAAVANNMDNIDHANVDQKLEIANIDLASALPFLPKELIDSIKGVSNGTLTIKVADGKSAVINGGFNVSGASAGGQAFKGDTFASQQIALTIPNTTIAMPKGPKVWESYHATTGTEQAPITLKLDQVTATVFADMGVQSLLDVIGKKKPGDNGMVRVAVNANVGQLFKSLPHLLHVADDVAVESGQLNYGLEIAMTPEEAKVSTKGAIKDVKGRRAGQPIALQPIDFSATATSIGAIGNVPRLRDLKLDFSSAFASAGFTGNTLADLKGNAKAQLEAMQKELGQIINFGDLKLAGAMNVDIKSDGDLMKEDGFSDARLDAYLTNLQVSGLAGKQPITQPRVETHIKVHAVRGKDDFIEQIQNIELTTQVGEAGAPLLDLAMTSKTVDLRGGNVKADFDISKLDIDAVRTERGFGVLVPALKEQNIKLLGGTISVLVTGSYDAKGDRMSISLADIKTKNLSVSKAGQNVLIGYSTTLQAAADVSMADGIAAKVSKLSLSDPTNLVKLSSDGLTVNVTTDKASKTSIVAPQGAIQIGANLAELSRIAQAFSGAAPNPNGQVKTGNLDGTLQLSSGNGGAIGCNGNFNVANLVVTTPTGVTDPQTIAVKLNASASGDFKAVTAQSITVQSKLINAAITDVQADLAAKAVFDLLKKANVKIDVPDLPALYALANAFVPPPAATPVSPQAPKVTKSAAPEKPAEVLPPLEITGGVLSVSATVDHTVGGPMNVNVSDVSANNIAFKRGAVAHAALPVNLKLAAAIATVGDKITQIQVTHLVGKLGIAELSMPSPISINDPTGSPTASGSIKLDGKIEDATRLLEALQAKSAGELFPYTGAYAVNQTLGSQGNKITMSGAVQINQFNVLNKTDKKPVFTEKLIDIKNDLWVEMPTNSVSINNLTMKMTSSDALAVAVKGGISDWVTARNLNGIQADVTYDLAKLWPIIKPMLSKEQQEQFKDMQVAGKFTKTFLVGGSYPANVPMQQAIQKLTASGSLAVQLFDYNGLNVQNLEIPITLRDGVVSTIYADKSAGANVAPPAIANAGQLDMSSISMDLRQDPPRVSTPPNKAIIKGVTINPVFANTWLKHIINNPVFSGAQNATGTIDLTIVECKNLPAGQLLMMQNNKANNGYAKVMVSINELHIGGQGVSKLLSKALNQDSFEAHVKDGVIEIANGIVTENILFETGKYKLGFNGKVGLQNLNFMPMNLSLPGAEVARKAFKIHDENVLKWIPDQVTFVLEGTVDNVKLNTEQGMQKLIQDATTKALLSSVTGGDKNKKNPKDDKGKKQDDPLKDLIDIFGNKKKK